MNTLLIPSSEKYRWYTATPASEAIRMKRMRARTGANSISFQESDEKPLTSVQNSAKSIMLSLFMSMPCSIAST
ncbi:hypothetical protein PRIPAC_93917 [Pristionchus pacificus]|uniref:Uncharacterized protein n=1 Tax=Pristionchus pacificus TaxID=54126 RepID=A0A2A6CD59_PRIPA|nr:hypothetical protein PRIPAC_93917 [Pristionchus pacificus]|eukprot:PDM76059.1 hypothetical protein PRIPAC_39663 [Pristionchus pacificus]